MQSIFVAGYPFGEQVSKSVKVTDGIVSSLSGLGDNFSQIQISAALQPGNSGGPVFDKNGNVVGVAVAKLALKYTLEKFGVIPENTNFGIKSSVLANFLQSNNIKFTKASSISKSNSSLSKMITDATYYLSCWMTMAQINNMKTEKVLFSNFK